MADVPLIAARSFVVSAATTSYTTVPTSRLFGDSNEDRRYCLFREPGTFSKLFVSISANTVTANTTITLRKNATTDGNLTLTIGSSATGIFEDTTHTDTSAAGDKWAYRVVGGATGTSISIRMISVLFAATTNTMSRHCILATSTTATTTTYFALAGATGSLGDATENNTKAEMQRGGTFKNLYVRCRSNSKTGNTPVRFRVNGANGTNVITIGSSATGDFEDTTHNDAINAGDDINLAYETSVAGTQICTLFSIGFETTTELGLIYANPMTATTQAEALTRYYFLGGEVDTGMTTEPLAQFKTRTPLIFSNLTIHITANAITGTSTFKTRVNGADGFSSCSIGSTATGYFTDSTNWEECDADDLVNYALVTPTVGGGLTITVRAVSVITEPFVPANNVVRAVPTETITVSAGASARLSAKLRSLAAQSITIGAGTSARLGAKIRPIATQTTSLSDSVARLKTSGANNVVRAVPTQTIVLTDNRARLAIKQRPIATQTTTLSDSVVRVKTPFGGGPADMSEVAAKTYANKFITKV